MATSQLHGYWRLPEPRLSFDPTDAAQVAVNPLVGLRDHGPFTARVLRDVTLHIALLAPTEADLKLLRKQLNELVHEYQPKERRAYLPPWPGFETVFHAVHRDVRRALMTTSSAASSTSSRSGCPTHSLDPTRSGGSVE